MECFRNYIGVKGCGQPEPLSGLYINSLPGITLRSIDEIANSEQVTFVNVWKDVQDRALNKFRTNVISGFRKEKKYKIKTISQMVDLGRRIDTVDGQTTALAQYRGFTIELTFSGDIYTLRSSLQSIYVQTLAVYTPVVTSGLVVKIFDLDTAEELYTKTIASTVAGWNSINVFQNFNADRVFVCYDASSVDSVLQNILPATSSCGSCVQIIYGDYCQGQVYGAYSTDLANPTEIDRDTNSYGMSGVVSVQCRYDWIVCNNKEHFANALLYLLGAEMMIERLHSETFSQYTTIGIKDAEELQGFFQAEFESQLEAAIGGIDIDLSDCCIECQSQVSHKKMLP